MAWTQSDIDKLEAAIATGQKKVQYKDRTIEYQDTHGMLKALSAMKAEVAAAGGTVPFTLASTRKGV